MGNELKKVKNEIEYTLNNLQIRYDEVSKNQDEIKRKLDTGELFNDPHKLHDAQINAYQNGGELQALSFAISEIQHLFNKIDENK